MCDRASKLSREILHEGDHEAPEGQIDIIVVDGLHGPRRKTWTAENGYQWLQRGLNRDVPGARIILWGLEATVEEGIASCLTSSNECLSFHARKLLEDVLEQRLVTSRISRPIIFLAHGLGGLLVQKALALAEESHKNTEDSHRWYSIRLSTRAVVLLDTPYTGHHEYSFEKMIQNIASMYSEEEHVFCNRMSVPTSEHFETAEQIKCLVKKVFAEGEATAKSGTEIRVIPQDSSDQSMTLKANHMTLTKFSSPDDQGYQNMTALLKTLEHGAEDQITLQWMSEVSEKEQELGPDHTVTLDAMHGLAERWSWKKESHEKASKLMNKVVIGNEAQRGNDHPATLVAIRDSGLMFLSAWGNKAERFKNASAILEPLLSRFEETFGKEHEATIRLLDTLGHVRHVRLDYQGAEVAYARASVAKEKVFGAGSVVFARSSYYLSSTQVFLQYERSAEHNLKRAIYAYTRELGPDALMTILAWDMLGMVFMGQKRPIDAENVFIDLLDILEKKFGRDHFDTLACCHNLSLAYMMQPQHLVKAEQMNRRVVEGLSKRPGPPTQFFLGVLNTTATIQQERGFYKQAEKSYKKLIPQCEEHLSPEAQLTRQVISCLALVYQRQGKIKKAQAADARAKGGNTSAAPPPSVWSSMRSWVSDKKQGFSSGDNQVKATFSSGPTTMPEAQDRDAA